MHLLIPDNIKIEDHRHEEYQLFLVPVVVFMSFGPQNRTLLSLKIRMNIPSRSMRSDSSQTDSRSLSAWTSEDGKPYAGRLNRLEELPESHLSHVCFSSHSRS